MDFKKDTKENNNGQLDDNNQGQFMVQGNTSIAVLKSISDFDEINHEISITFLQKKAEKLTAALYIVTGFLSDNEPIKWGIREAGVTVLTDVSSFGSVALSNKSQCIKKMMSDIERTISLLEISSIAGFLSDMNLAILKEEYLFLAQSLSVGKKRGPEESFVFGREFFSTRGNGNRPISEEGRNEESHKGQIKDTVSDSNLSLQKKTEPSSPYVTKITPESFSKSQSTSVDLGITDFQKTQEKSSRREMILSLVREKGEVSIKDVALHFSDCGEKTIQRELSSLVLSNVLKKTGDRRWSKYSLS